MPGIAAPTTIIPNSTSDCPRTPRGSGEVAGVPNHLSLACAVGLVVSLLRGDSKYLLYSPVMPSTATATCGSRLRGGRTPVGVGVGHGPGGDSIGRTLWLRGLEGVKERREGRVRPEEEVSGECAAGERPPELEANLAKHRGEALLPATTVHEPRKHNLDVLNPARDKDLVLPPRARRVDETGTPGRSARTTPRADMPAPARPAPKRRGPESGRPPLPRHDAGSGSEGRTRPCGETAGTRGTSSARSAWVQASMYIDACTFPARLATLTRPTMARAAREVD